MASVCYTTYTTPIEYLNGRTDFSSNIITCTNCGCFIVINDDPYATTTTRIIDTSIYHDGIIGISHPERIPEEVKDTVAEYWDKVEDQELTEKGWKEKPVQKLDEPTLKHIIMAKRLTNSMSGWVAKKGKQQRSGH